MSGNKRSHLKFSVFIVFFFLFFIHFAGCRTEQNDYKKLIHPQFTIEHPRSWNVIPASLHYSINGPIVENYVVNFKIDYNPEANLHLNLFRETVESQNQLQNLPGYVSVEEKELDINGVPALQRVIKTDVVLAQNQQVTLMVMLTYIVKDDQFGVVFTAEVPENHYLTYRPIFNTMIQSFRFR